MSGNNAFPTPSSTISMSDLNSALGQSSTTSISFNDTRVRFLSNQDSGSVTMNGMRNKFYSDGNVGPIDFVIDKGYSYQFGYASPPIFGSDGTQSYITSYSDPSNAISDSIWASDIGLGGRTYRLQVDGGTIYTLPYADVGVDAGNWYVAIYDATSSGQAITYAMYGGTYPFKIASV